MDTKRSQRYNKKKKRKLKLIPFLTLVAILSLTGSIFVTNAVFTIISKNEAKQHSKIQADEKSKETSYESTTQQSIEKKENFPTSADGTVLTPIPADKNENLSKTVLSSDAQSMNDELENNSFVGVALIIKNGKIILQKGYGYSDFANNELNTVSSRYQIGSVEKSLTATLIYNLVEEGKLSFDTPLSTFYPQITGSEDIQVNDLLHMKSGLEFKFPKNMNFNNSQESLEYLVSHVQYTGNKIYNYQAINYNILAGIVQKITKENFYEYFNNFYSHKLKLKDFGSYTDWPNRKNKTIGYNFDKSKNTDQYANPTAYDPQKFIRELGSGNIDSTTGTMYHYFHSLINYKIIGKETLDKAWIVDNSRAYIGGMYDKNVAYRTFGSIASEDLLILMSKDAQNAVILMSNCASPNVNNHLISDLYYNISGNFIEF